MFSRKIDNFDVHGEGKSCRFSAYLEKDDIEFSPDCFGSSELKLAGNSILPSYHLVLSCDLLSSSLNV